MRKTMKVATVAGLFSAAAAFTALPLMTHAVAATKKSHAMKSSKSSMKSNSAKSGSAKGNTGDPLNAAAGKKM